MALFIPNPHLERELLESAALREVIKAKAERAAEVARRVAPVRTGAYRDSIHVEDSGDGAEVVADVPYAVFLEFGTSDTPTFAPLRRGLQSLGE